MSTSITRLFNDLASMQETFNVLLNSNINENSSLSFPFANIYQTEDSKVRVSIAMPGITPDNIDITWHQNKFQISGQRDNKGIKNAQQLRSERGFGKFKKVIDIKTRINPDTVTATYENGLLLISADLAEDEKPRKIQID